MDGFFYFLMVVATLVLGFGVPIAVVITTARDEARRTKSDPTIALALGGVVVLAMAFGWMGGAADDRFDGGDHEPRAIRSWAD